MSYSLPDKPGRDFTPSEVMELLRETRRLTESIDPSPAASARAQSPSTTPSGGDLFMQYVAAELEKDSGVGVPEALRLAAVAQPGLHAAYIAEFNAKSKADARSKRDASARALARRQG